MSDLLKKTIHLPDGTELVGRYNISNDPKADILFCHGFQEYSGRYTREARYFGEHGYNFLSYDQRSHGESSGQLRSWVNDFDKYVTDLETMIKHYNVGTERAFFLFAHSMGALVTISFLLDRKYHNPFLKGVVFSAPLLAPNSDMAPILQKMSSFISALFPKLKTLKLDINEISRDPVERRKYAEDPLIYTDGIYARSADSLLKQMKKVNSRFHEFAYPIIIQHGIQDKLTEYGGSRELIERSSSKDKSLIPLEGFKHEITRDIGHESVLENFLQWMDDRI